jgi:hypothetical protein
MLKRVDIVLQAILQGARLYDLEAISVEHKWEVSTRTLQRYAAEAERQLEKSFEADRGKLLRFHVGNRHTLLARAMADGDWRTALSVVNDLAELQGLYPRKGFELTGANGAPLVEKQTDAERAAAVAAVLSHFGIVTGGPAATPGAASDPADSRGPAVAD